MRCATHPSVETELRCGRCEVAICPRCLVHTPVGARCRQCAQLRRAPPYELRPLLLVRAGTAGLAAGGAVGALWALVVPVRTSAIGFFSLIVAVALGWTVAWAVSAAARGKRGPALQGAALLGVMAAYLARNAVLGGEFFTARDLSGFVSVIIAALVAVAQLR